jgi:hypothetical protein
MRRTPVRILPAELSGAALAASRQVWLAGLGAAVVSRDWLQSEAGNTFRSLVREGTVVESRAIRFVGDQLETGVTRANHVWRRTRATVQARVRQAADSAVLFVTDVLPRRLPGSNALVAAAPATPPRKRPAAKRAKPVAVKAGKRAKRTAR